MWKPGQLVTIAHKVYRITKCDIAPITDKPPYMWNNICTTCRTCRKQRNSYLCLLIGEVKCLKLMGPDCYPKPLEPKSSIG